MEMSDTEVMMILTSVLILPAIVVLTLAFFNGNFKDVEATKYVVLREPDEDPWASAPAREQGGERA